MRRAITAELLINRQITTDGIADWADLDVIVRAYVERDEEGGYYYEGIKLWDEEGRKVRVHGEDELTRVQEALTDAYNMFDPDDEETEVDE